MNNAALGASMTPPAVNWAGQAKLALRRMAKSVNVITCMHEGVRYAMAATAADALSMDPPSMIVSVNRSASLHAPLSAGANFCINVLSRQQEEISRACGGKLKGEERFALGKWLEGVEIGRAHV